MSLIKGIYAASMSVLNDNLTLNVSKTVEHAEKLIDRRLSWSCNFWEHWSSTTSTNFREN